MSERALGSNKCPQSHMCDNLPEMRSGSEATGPLGRAWPLHPAPGRNTRFGQNLYIPCPNRKDRWRHGHPNQNHRVLAMSEHERNDRWYGTCSMAVHQERHRQEYRRRHRRACLIPPTANCPPPPAFCFPSPPRSAPDALPRIVYRLNGMRG
jgi:hypothetical protein